MSYEGNLHKDNYEKTCVNTLTSRKQRNKNF